MSTELLRAQHQKIHHPSRMAISALGIAPEIFSDSADRFFAQIKDGNKIENKEESCVNKGEIGIKEGEDKNDIYKGGSIRSFVEDRHKETFYSVAFKTGFKLIFTFAKRCV